MEQIQWFGGNMTQQSTKLIDNTLVYYMIIKSVQLKSLVLCIMCQTNTHINKAQ